MRPSTVTANKRRPEWNSLQTDLTVHKLTMDELERRRLSRRSKNLEVAKNELYTRLHSEQSRLRRRADSERSKLRSALQRGTQLEQREVYDLLARTDRQLALIADLIGERGKKHRGVPNVTTAPGVSPTRDPASDDEDGEVGWLPYHAREVESQLDLLSNSVMNVTALNDETNLPSQKTTASKTKPTNKANSALRPTSSSRKSRENGALVDSNAENSNPASPLRSVRNKQRNLTAASQSQRSGADAGGNPNESANASPKRDARKSTAKKNDTSRSANQSARSLSASPSSRLRSPQKSVRSEAEKLASARLQAADDRTKLEKIIQVWTGNDRSGAAAPTGVDQFDVLCEVCITVRQLERALNTERLIRERTETIAAEQRELIDALTAELIETQQRIAGMEQDFSNLQRQVVAKAGPIPVPAATLKQFDTDLASAHSKYESRRYDASEDRYATEVAAYTKPAESDSGASVSVSAGTGPLNSGASVLKEVDRLKEQYRAIQSKLNNVLQRSAQTLRSHGGASPTRLSPNEAADDRQPVSKQSPTADASADADESARFDDSARAN